MFADAQIAMLMILVVGSFHSANAILRQKRQLARQRWAADRRCGLLHKVGLQPAFDSLRCLSENRCAGHSLLQHVESDLRSLRDEGTGDI